MKHCSGAIFFRTTLSLTIIVWTLVSCSGGVKNPPPPKGGPPFVINSPEADSRIAGTVFFSAQPFNANDVASVNFTAGDTDLGTDTDASDGFKVFLSAQDFPEGELVLTATVTGKNGKTSSQSITVTAVPSPPSTATVTREGAALGTTEADGALSTLVIPAGAAEGAEVSFEARTKEEVKAATGVDYDALGVTFLGAQKIDASEALETPLAVTSGGFGPMVQPGQVVVNYTIAPDADGDGVGELIVVNAATVTPNGDVISDPVPKIQLGSATATDASGTRSLRTLQAGTLSGPPGTFIEIEATGFNAFSILGNVARFKSSVDGTEIELPASVNNHYEDEDSLPTVGFYIPPLPAGAATMRLHNVNTNETTGPINISVEVPPALSDAPAVIIDQTLADMIATLATVTEVADALGQLEEARRLFAELSSNPTPEEEQVLESIASFIANSNISELLNQIEAGGSSNLRVQSCSIPQLLFFNGITGLGVAGATIGLATAFSVAIFGGSALLLAGGLAMAYWASGLAGVGTAGLLFTINNCFTPPPPTCLPPYTPETLPPGAPQPGGLRTQQTPPPAITGMGSAPPPGGDSCGTAVGGAASNGDNDSRSLQTQQTGIGDIMGDLAGRFIVKVFYGGTNVVPFTGISDSSGYFYLPLIPENQPFQAIATDTLTGETRSFEGVGPEVGQSTYMYFDFLTEGDNVVTNISYDSNTSGDYGDVDFYQFEGEAGDLFTLALFSEQAPQELVTYNVTGPDGLSVAGGSFAGSHVHETGVRALRLDGVHTITIDGSLVAGGYTLGFARVEPPTAATPPGALVGNLNTLGKRHFYVLSGEGGETLDFGLSHDGGSALFAKLAVREYRSGDDFYDAPLRRSVSTTADNRSRSSFYPLPGDGEYILEVGLADFTADALENHLGSYQVTFSLSP